MRLQITKYNEEVENIEVYNFDILQFADEMKNNESNGIVIGNQYFWKIDIRHLKIIDA